ncbi:hypothetical protein NLI96_g2018 [Meripilus lineatus]|uniref:PLC-like phosphodiesterase n=1 Tax=Meripilus lineatus TaxID=2056292 RepID=A0AAD5YKD0_9APHY|nr:hypothetical protein NLI96_g2018 [Physisporinus lineatus]
MRISYTHLTQAVLSLAILSVLPVFGSSLHRRATVCNGHPERLWQRYGPSEDPHLLYPSNNSIQFVGAHNSYAVGVNDLFANQDYDGTMYGTLGGSLVLTLASNPLFSVSQQLKDGVRMLQMQAHELNGGIQLCHTACSLNNGGTLVDYLKKVISLLIVNSDNLSPTLYDAAFKSAELDALAYAPPSASLPASGWPTLGNLIDTGKRLVVFLSTTADFATVPYLIDEFTNIWETAFDVTDPNFDCNVNRTKGDPTTQMFLINHFLDKIVLGQPAPFRDQANVTNGVSGLGSLGVHVQTCVADHGRNPNFLLVDFYEFGGGSVFQVAADANGVTYDPATPVATPISETSATGGPVSSGSTSSKATLGFRVTESHIYASLAIVASLSLGALSVF